MTSELSDEDMGDDDDDEAENDDEEGDQVMDPDAERRFKEDRLKNLVPALPAEEWGRKEVPSTTTPLRPTQPPTGSSSTTDNASASASAKDNTANRGPPGLSDRYIPAKMRPPVLAKFEYDGVVDESDDDDSEDEADLPPPGTLGRKIAEMKWGDGEDRVAEAAAESRSQSAKIEEIDDEDDGTEPRRKFGLGDDIDEAMERKVRGDERPVIVPSAGTTLPEEDEEMEIDPDFDQEQEDFIKFSREALGISDEMWKGIVDSREARGGEYSGPASLACFSLHMTKSPLSKG